MRRLILLSPILLMACETPTTEYIYVQPDVPATLRQPCPVSDRVAETYRDLAVLATEHLNTARCANGRIVALDAVLLDAEAR